MEGNRQKGTRERRYRVECVATVPEVDKLQARIQLQSGSCRTDSAGTVICQGIYPSPTIEISQPEWSSRSDHAWSAWTGCSRPCGGGMRSRWRLRGQPSAASLSAVGSNDIGAPEAEREEQSCNTHPCPVLHQAPHLRGAKPAGQDTHEPGKYGLVYAIIAGLCGAALGIAVVLIPYLIYVNRTRKQATKRGRQEQRSSVWRKLNERRLNSERNMPYIWFADTDRSEKAAVKQMLLQRKKANNSLEAATVGPSVERAKTGASRPKETIGDSPSTLQTQASAARPGPHRNASLTRIQALHNDHRGTIKNRNISPLSMNEPIVPWEHTTTERNGLNPAFVDSSPPQPHVDHGRVFNKSPISTYDPTAETVNTITKCPSLFHAQGAVANNPNTQKDEIIYASA
ncbi:unnamed protein product [Echinostoma caproni]|uniref:Thrombospondin type-1 domain-containing protein 1 n=1 Tax=Echinostoma caproni TaxID=27848 RepID=A0A183ALU1_9TREM|nr:unnamed protein product [Echinostoma caproni]